MSKKKQRKYVIYTLRKGYCDKDFKWYDSWYTRGELIKHIAWMTESDGSNAILDNLSMDMSETRCEFTFVKSNNQFVRDYFEYKRIYFIGKLDGNASKRIDVESIIDELNIEIIKANKAREASRKKREHEKKLMSNYEFRKDPVPGIHNYNNCHRGDTYRHPHTTKSRRNNYYEDEYGKFEDKKTKSLPNVWDDLVRHRDKSWKTSCKIKRQWMKHVRKHVDTVNYNKKHFNVDIVDVE